MRVAVFGSTGLVGSGVLLEALDSPEVDEVVSIVRRPSGVEHGKLREIVHDDFEDFSSLTDDLTGLDACFWCLGISAVGLDEPSYTRITHDFTLAAARVLEAQSPELCFCFVSGAGTDSSEKGRQMWARVKGRTENALRDFGFRDLRLFRPALIRARRGNPPRSAAYRMLAPVLAVFDPVLRAVGSATSNVEIGRAMIAAAQGRATKQVLGSKHINALAALA